MQHVSSLLDDIVHYAIHRDQASFLAESSEGFICRYFWSHYCAISWDLAIIAILQVLSALWFFFLQAHFRDKLGIQQVFPIIEFHYACSVRFHYCSWPKLYPISLHHFTYFHPVTGFPWLLPYCILVVLKAPLEKSRFALNLFLFFF